MALKMVYTAVEMMMPPNRIRFRVAVSH